MRAKNDTIAKSANTETTARKSPITERILPEISRTIERILSTSTNVTCGPEFARMSCFHASLSAVYVETK
jgi:hypothetical protein